MQERARGIRALIIGGGIGGLTAATALRHNGIDVTVFERADDLRKIQVGGSIIVWCNAMAALQQVGLADRIRAAGAPLQKDLFRSWRGELLGEWPVAEMERKYGAPNIGLSRGGLHRTLAGALDEGVLQLGAECTGFSQDATGVTAYFADGREERGDLLIGADGIKSVIRAQLFGDAKPRYAGYTLWQATVPMDGDSVGVSQLFFGRGQRFVLARLTPEHAHWIAVANAPEGGLDTDKAMILARYKGWMEPIEAIIEATEDKAIRRMDVVDRKPARRWGEGRVTLLGDAAHPITWDLGQGSCQAIEDAVVLGKSLRKNRKDAAAALRAYEVPRRIRTALLVNQSRRIGWAASWENPAACELRDVMLKLTWNRGMRLATERLVMAHKV